MMHYEFILFVTDQHRSRDFYRQVLQREPSLDVPGMVEFSLTPECKLGLLQQENAVKILENRIPDPEKANGIPRCELYLTVDNPESYLSAALHAGARKISETKPRNWGDSVAYCADPDGHIIGFAKKNE